MKENLVKILFISISLLKLTWLNEMQLVVAISTRIHGNNPISLARVLFAVVVV